MRIAVKAFYKWRVLEIIALTKKRDILKTHMLSNVNYNTGQCSSGVKI